MINWLRTPTTPEVAKYVERYWFLEKQPGSHSYQYPKLNPDPTGHLIIAPPEQPYHYELDTTSAKGEGCHWIFSHTQTFRLDHSQPFLSLALSFALAHCIRWTLQLSSPCWIRSQLLT